MARRKRILVPGAKDALDELKRQVIQDQSHSTDPVQRTRSESPGMKAMAEAKGIPYSDSDNGELTTRQAGKLGGSVGGPMVKRLILLAEQNLERP